MLASSVRSGWVAFSTPLEGCKNFPYLDTHVPPIVTTAIGCAIESLSSMQALPWLHADGAPASPSEIEDAWNKLRAMRGGYVAEYYLRACDLHLGDADVESLTLGRLDSDAEILTKFWPDLPSFPEPAQAALASLAWAVGPGSQDSGITGHTWPHFHQAVAARDWQAAAQSGQLSWVKDPGVRPRDFANSALFLMAAGATGEDTKVGWVAGPSSETAAKALAAFSFNSQ